MKPQKLAEANLFTMSAIQVSLREQARNVLLCENAEKKAQCAFDVFTSHQKGEHNTSLLDTEGWPERPGRPEKPELLDPRDMPKRRSGGHAGRIGLLHALAHIELNAIDLAFDLLGRYENTPMPEEFYFDWLRVGAEEAKHFMLLQGRLKSLGSSYGALPAHDGLWEAALNTAHNLAARLAVVPMVLEARGLDVTPQMIEKLTKNGDKESADILEVIYEDEKTHVAIGSKWFSYLCQKQNKDPQTQYQNYVQTYFRGDIKPPFNKPARDEAGLPEEFYIFAR